MARPKRRLFGPLLYSTLILGALVVVYAMVNIAIPTLQERRELQELLTGLHSEHANVRETCATLLLTKGVGNGLSPYLVEATDDPKPEVRAAAIRALAYTPTLGEAVIPLLLKAAADADDEVRLTAATGLGRLTYFTSRRVGSVQGSTEEVEDTPTSRCVGSLRKLLVDPADEIRVAAATSLGEFAASPDVVKALVAALSDTERDVQIEAARSLLKVNGPNDADASRALLALLATPEPFSRAAPVPGSPSVGTEPLRLVAVLKAASTEAQEKAVDILVKLIGSDDESTRVRAEAGDALLEFGPLARKALPKLDQMTSGKVADVRAVVRKVIAAIEGKDGPRYVAIQLETLTDASLPEAWRWTALEALREVRPVALAKATRALVGQLADPDPNVRKRALALLDVILVDNPAELPSTPPSP